jgi:phosphoglycolate phosphatase-like HAD superfamily hydrolase
MKKSRVLIETMTTGVNTEKYSRPRRNCILSVVVVAAALHVASSFHIISPLSTYGILNSGERDAPSLSSRRKQLQKRRFHFTEHWSSSFQQEGSETDKEKEKEEKKAYDSLYEFLTKRTGETAGESERERKIDRIRKWVRSSSKRSSNAKMVQPVRVEDGAVMEEAQPPPKNKASLDRLFSGMPTLDNMLSRSDSSDGREITQEASDSEARKGKNDDSWFDAEKEKIQEEYTQTLNDVKSQIAQQRAADPEGIPANAEAIAESVVTQEMKRMITSVKIARAKERFQEMENKRMVDLNSNDLAGSNNELAERLLREATEDWKRRDARQAEVDNFQQYEREAFQNLADGNSDFIPQPGSDLDAWALERLEVMLESSREGSELSISDILEENIEDLQERLVKQSKKGSVAPQTMKEWQMYRAIATRLKKQKINPGISDPLLNQDEITEQMITKQLNSWREYIGKEGDIRERSGLTAGPKMPFDWQRAAKDTRTNTQSTNKKSRKEIRREVNLQAIQALEDLVQKSDKSRAENLKKQLEILKAELEPRDYYDVEKEPMEEASMGRMGPVDLSGVFRSEEESEEEPSIGSAFSEFEKYGIDRMMSGDALRLGEIQDVAPPPPPNSDFFSDSFEDTEKPEPPKTPFFTDDLSDDFDTGAINAQGEAINAQGEYSKLGSGEEQKLRAMYQRAGARTKEEQDALREQWEAFQSFEKAKRDEWGLYDSSDSSLIDKANLKYDVSDVMTGDGDFDAQKVLASIGPRPVRKKASTTSAKRDTDVDPTEVSDALYRTVAAVGGGRSKDDPSIKEKEKADFEEYMQKEEELRQGLDSIDKNAAEMATSTGVELDGDRYAQDALASIGPRPSFNRKKKRLLDEREYRDRGGVLSSEDEDSSDVDDESSGSESSAEVDLIPDWLEKEQKAIEQSDSYSDKSGYFSGNDIDDVFDDDKYEHNLRQLAEYERRRSGKKQQMGIDISDALGRRGSDDYADYTYDADYFREQQGGWGSASFDARKASLLEYVELNIAELNNLIDHRDSIYSTGVSEYLPRINKPFSEFGAIFRLEGVIVDLTGLHQQVWTQIAKEFDFREPMFEDIQRAAVARPDVAVRDLFFWTNDVVLVRKVTDTFRKLFRDAFDQWAKEQGINEESTATSLDEGGNKGMMALGAEEIGEDNNRASMAQENAKVPAAPMNEQTRMLRLKESWSTTAKEFGFSPPANEQVAQCSFLSPDIAVREIFRWSSNPQEVDVIVSYFSQLFSGVEPGGRQTNVASANPSSSNIDEGTILELQFLAWGIVAEEASFAAPTPEEVLAAYVLNDPEAVIAYGFGWTDDGLRRQELAKRYFDCFSELVNERLHHRSSDVKPPTVQPDEKVVAVKPAVVGPTAEEVLESQIEAWNEVARIHNLQAPASDQIQLTMNMAADESVRRLLGWTYNFNNDQINEISTTYEEALKTAFSKYLKSYNMKIEPLSTPQAAQGSISNDVSTDELHQAAFDAWSKVADRFSYPPPDEEQVLFAMTVGPEEAIITGFRWADNMVEANKIAANYYEEIKLKRADWHRRGLSTTATPDGGAKDDEAPPLVKVLPGVETWIKSLYEVEMGCGVASHLEDDQLDTLLEYAGLAKLLPPGQRVSCNRGYDRDSQQMLGVALRIERRPDHCVVFDSSPQANAAAQEIEMRCVSLVGPYPRYELLSADTSAFSFDELTAMNIRRLFGERVYDQPMLDTQPNLETVKKTKTMFWDDL